MLQTFRPLTFAFILGLGLSCFAQISTSSTPSAENPLKDATAVVTVKGKNICLGCSLKKEQGAGAQCSIYGHKHVLEISKVDSEGEKTPTMNGWILHYLETAKSEELIKGHHGEALTLRGKVYPNARVFEVISQD